MPDILRELKAYGCEVLVHDPYCDPEEAKMEYGVDLIKKVNEIALGFSNHSSGPQAV